jgi:hypothetical protein
LSARRYRIDLRGDEQGLRLHWRSPAPALVRASMLLLPEGRELELAPGVTDLCLGEHRGCVPLPTSIEVIVSNADPDGARWPTLSVSGLR